MNIEFYQNISEAIILLIMIYLLYKLTCAYIGEYKPNLASRLRNIKNKICKNRNK